MDKVLAECKIGQKINWDEALKILNDRIYVFDNNEKWFISKFIEFQYGKCLNSQWSAHKGVIKALEHHGIKEIVLNSELNILQIISNCLVTVPEQLQDKDKDKDKVKDKDKEGSEGGTNIPNEDNYVKRLFPQVQIVKLLKKDYDDLCLKYSKDVIDNKICDIENYCKSKGCPNKYKDFRATIIMWIRREQ